MGFLLRNRIIFMGGPINDGVRATPPATAPRVAAADTLLARADDSICLLLAHGARAGKPGGGYQGALRALCLCPPASLRRHTPKFALRAAVHQQPRRLYVQHHGDYRHDERGTHEILKDCVPFFSDFSHRRRQVKCDVSTVAFGTVQSSAVRPPSSRQLILWTTLISHAHRPRSLSSWGRGRKESDTR